MSGALPRDALLRGVLAATPTPLTADLDADHGALIEHCQRLLYQGCDGVVVLGTTGEANSFSVRERLAMIDALEMSGHASVALVGTGCCAVEDTVRLTRAAVGAGAAGVLMLPPFYYKQVTDEGLFLAYAAVLAQVADPRLRVYLYSFPGLTGLRLSVNLVRRLMRAFPGVVVGLKDSSGDWPAMAEMLRALPELALFAGTEDCLLDNLRAGGPGCISATVNLSAPLAAELRDGFGGPDADELQRRLGARRQLLRRHPTIAAIKAVLARHTDHPGWARVRPPLVPLDAAAAEQLVAELAR